MVCSSQFHNWILVLKSEKLREYPSLIKAVEGILCVIHRILKCIYYRIMIGHITWGKVINERMAAQEALLELSLLQIVTRLVVSDSIHNNLKRNNKLHNFRICLAMILNNVNDDIFRRNKIIDYGLLQQMCIHCVLNK